MDSYDFAERIERIADETGWAINPPTNYCPHALLWRWGEGGDSYKVEISDVGDDYTQVEFRIRCFLEYEYSEDIPDSFIKWLNKVSPKWAYWKIFENPEECYIYVRTTWSVENFETDTDTFQCLVTDLVDVCSGFETAVKEGRIDRKRFGRCRILNRRLDMRL